MKIKSIAIMVFGVFNMGYVYAQNTDITTDTTLAISDIHERYFITNSGTETTNVSVNNDLTVAEDGAFHLGFAGKTDSEAGSLANGDINMTINGNMNVYADTWIGKFDTRMFTAWMGLYPDFPTDPITHNVDLKITGDLNVGISGDKKMDGLMIAAGNVMGTGSNTTGTTTVTVDGNTNISGGGNHLAGSSNAAAKLITKTFNLTGGDIEIIGSNTVLQTTNTDVTKSSVLVGNDAKMTIMRGATVDVSQGGNFNVVDHAILSGGSGDGSVVLAKNGQLNIGQQATIQSYTGSLNISDKTSQTSQLNIAGKINFGASTTGSRLYTITGDNINIGSTARFNISKEFITTALNYTTSIANLAVLSANNTLTISGMKNNDNTHIENIYGQFNFQLSGNNLLFVNTTDATDFTNDSSANTAAEKQIGRYYQSAGIDTANIAERFTQNLAKVAKAVSYKSKSLTGNLAQSDGSQAGNLNWAVFEAIADGNREISSSDTATEFTQAFAGLYNNNRGLHISEIALNSVKQTKAAIDRRTNQFYQSQNLADKQDNLWIEITRRNESTDTLRGMTGYKYSENGFIIGYDKTINHLLVGLALGHSYGEYKDKSAVTHDSDLTHYMIEAYASYKFSSNIFASAYAGYARSDNNLKENDGFYWAKEDFNSNTWNVGSQVGYDWQVFDQLTLTPTLGLSYIYTQNSAHDVTYNDIALLKYSQSSNSALLIPFDLAVNYSLLQRQDAQLILTAKTGYAYNLLDNEFDSDITVNGVSGLATMSSNTTHRGKHQFNIGGGMAFKYNPVELAIGYQYYGQRQHDAHYMTAVAKVSF